MANDAGWMGGLRPLAVLAAVVVVGAGGAAAASRPVPPERWHAEKCARYERAWAAEMAAVGRAGLSPAFLAAHAAFLAAKCNGSAMVCPRSPEELRVANDLVVRSMNFGAASTFAPFACP